MDKILNLSMSSVKKKLSWNVFKVLFLIVITCLLIPNFSCAFLNGKENGRVAASKPGSRVTQCRTCL